MWARPQIHFRFCRHDPFRTLERGASGFYELQPQDDDEYREAVRQDITARVEEAFTVQILTAAYVVVVHDSTIRLSRWDRAGTVFSRKVDYTTDPSVLTEVFWRLSMLTNHQLGMDPTATAVLPGSNEYKLMDRLSVPRADDFSHEEGTVIEGDPEDPSRTFAYIRETLHTCLHNLKKDSIFDGVSPRWKVSVPLEDGSVREFLVCKPFSYRSPQKPRIDRRNGKAYIAIDCTTEKLVFLKDVWRFTDVDAGKLSEREGLVLKQLNEAGVSNVPTLLCEAELPEQETKTQHYKPQYHWTPDDDSISYSDIVAGLDLDEPVGPQPQSQPQPDDHEIHCVDYSGEDIGELHHYRMVVSEFCFSLSSSFRGGRQLVQGIRDCIFGMCSTCPDRLRVVLTHSICLRSLLAHFRAVEVLGRLHCDIGFPNIMAYPRIEVSDETGKPTIRWAGMLIDWELNRRIKEMRILPQRLMELVRLHFRY